MRWARTKRVPDEIKVKKAEERQRLILWVFFFSVFCWFFSFRRRVGFSLTLSELSEICFFLGFLSRDLKVELAFQGTSFSGISWILFLEMGGVGGLILVKFHFTCNFILQFFFLFLK